MAYVKLLNATFNKNKTKISGHILVDPHDHHKKVEVFFSCGMGEWKVEAASFVSVQKNGKELWSFSFYVPQSMVSVFPKEKIQCQMAIRLSYFWQEFWDNKQGENYRFKEMIRPAPSMLCFTSQRSLGVRMTLDGWKNFHDHDVYLQCPHSGTGWAEGTFTFPKNQVAEFVVFSESNHQRDWYNNGGQNYLAFNDGKEDVFYYRPSFST